jgi:uncharacterized membrane protein
MMGGYGHGYGGYGPMASGGSWFIAGLVLCFWFLIIVGIVLLVVWAVRASSGHGHGHAASQQRGPAGVTTPSDVLQRPAADGQDEAVAIARRRLASGEITAEQYAEIMRHLGG